jgi:hypothetical protein
MCLLVECPREGQVYRQDAVEVVQIGRLTWA